MKSQTASNSRNGRRPARSRAAPPAWVVPPTEKTDDLNRRQLLTVLTQLKRGDFSARLPEYWTGLDGKIADTFNEVVELNERMTRELENVTTLSGLLAARTAN
jgi:hypothetical protein